MSIEETLRDPATIEQDSRSAIHLVQPAPASRAASATALKVAWSLADQALAVGGGFLINVALARTQTKQEYGVFALTYSIFGFLLGLYYAAILEPCTVYGSGRYREQFSEYLRLIVRFNAMLCVLLTTFLLLACLVVSRVAPHLMSNAVYGLALTAGILLSGYLLRRLFYVQRQPALAAMSSLVFLLVVAALLELLIKAHLVNGFTAFVVLALGWVAAGMALGRCLRFGEPTQKFLTLEPAYWQQHWKYSKWVLATAFVFQFTTQGYYWLVGGFLSTTDVANLRAMYLLVAPMEQVFIALSYLIVPALAAYYATRSMGSFFSLWRRYVLAAIGVSAVYALATRTLGRSIVHVLYAGKYDGLTPYLFTLTFVPLVLWLGTTMAHALNAAEKPRSQFWAFVASAIATFSLGIPLVLHYRLWGAVYGMLLSSTTYTLALAVSFLLTFWKEGSLIVGGKFSLRGARQTDSAAVVMREE